MQLIDYIENSKSLIEDFSKWNATELIIDDEKSFWSLQHPESQCRKVCLFVDGYSMIVYGDYGSLIFSEMTWKGSVYNLKYDNIAYQMEKLDYKSRESLKEFKSDILRQDVWSWLKERLENHYNLSKEFIEEVTCYFGKIHYFGYNEIDYFCQKNNCNEISNILKFTGECLNYSEQPEWIAFLRNRSFQEFDEECESNLWKAGIKISQKYFINMYALQVCRDKLLFKKRI